MKRDQTAHERLIPMLVDIVGARVYLELGTYQGDTIKKVQCPVRIGVDRDIALSLTFPDRFYKMSTQEFIQKCAAECPPFDVVYIDADHGPTAVLADFHGIYPFVADEGLILMHDGNPQTAADTAPGYCDEAWKAIREITEEDEHEYEAVTLPYFPGLTIVRKRVQWGPR